MSQSVSTKAAQCTQVKAFAQFLCIWGESKISLWKAHKDGPPLLCVFCLLLGLIWWWSVAGQLLKSKRFTEKSVFLASLKTRSSVNTGFTFPSGTFCQSWGAANSTEQVPNPPATLPPVSPVPASPYNLPDQLQSFICQIPKLEST